MEKLIFSKLIFFSESQIGGIYKTVTAILEYFNNEKQTLAMRLDLSNAFESVDHCLLIKTVELYGIRGTVLELFKFCLIGKS